MVEVGEMSKPVVATGESQGGGTWYMFTCSRLLVLMLEGQRLLEVCVCVELVSEEYRLGSDDRRVEAGGGRREREALCTGRQSDGSRDCLFGGTLY